MNRPLALFNTQSAAWLAAARVAANGGPIDLAVARVRRERGGGSWAVLLTRDHDRAAERAARAALALFPEYDERVTL